MIDLLLLDKKNSVCYLYDWKTGGKDIDTLERFPKDTFQLEMYSAWVLDRFDIDHVYAGYVFVEHEYIQEPVYLNKSISPKKKFIDKIKKYRYVNDTLSINKNINNDV